MTYDEVLRRLEAVGWDWRDEVLMSPHDTMWLTREPWDMQRLAETMQSRRDRFVVMLRNLPADAEPISESLADVQQIVDVLEGR